MDEKDAEYQKMKERIKEVKRQIFQNKEDLFGVLADLDYGCDHNLGRVPTKADAEYHWNEIKTLKAELEELESKALPVYTVLQTMQMEQLVELIEESIENMKWEQKYWGTPCANRIMFYEYEIDELKQAMK